MTSEVDGLAEPLTAWARVPPVGEPMKWAEVDVAAIRDNAAALAAVAGPGCGLMAMVKANGYGHGAVLAALAALGGGARWLGVSSAEEALQLREAGIGARILVVNWAHPATMPALVERGVDLTVYDEVGLAGARAAAVTGRRAAVHVKVDTGMHRLGALPPDALELLQAVAADDRLELAGVFTHFADADGPGPEMTERQHAAFLPVAARARELADVVVHAANSAGMLRFPQARHDLVRPGLALYGYLPPHCAGTVAVRPALRVLAWVTRVLTVPAGESVGYGCTWQAPVATRVAVVSAGYADGVQRAQSNRGRVLVGGVPCPIVGLVSMDQVSVDVSAVGGVRPGDTAVVLGSRPGEEAVDADAVAAVVGTTAWEVLCDVSARVHRRVVGSDLPVDAAGG